MREIGYENVEPYAFVERAADLEKAFAATGLKAPSGHVAVIDAEDTAPIWDAAERLGIQTVIDPFIRPTAGRPPTTSRRSPSASTSSPPRPPLVG